MSYYLFRQQKLEKVMDQEGLADEEVSDKHTCTFFPACFVAVKDHLFSPVIVLRVLAFSV